MLFLLMVLRPDNPRVMTHCFPDLTTHRSPAVADEPGSQGMFILFVGSLPGRYSCTVTHTLCVAALGI